MPSPVPMGEERTEVTLLASRIEVLRLLTAHVYRAATVCQTSHLIIATTLMQKLLSSCTRQDTEVQKDLLTA